MAKVALPEVLKGDSVSTAYVRQLKKRDSAENEKWIDVLVEHADQVWHSNAHWHCPHPEHRKHSPLDTPQKESAETLLQKELKSGYQQSKYDAGQYFPRIWRSGKRYKDRDGRDWYPLPFIEELPEFQSFVIALQQIEVLFDDLTSVFRTVHPVPANSDAFGSRIRNLLILASTEVECQWRAVLEANVSQPPDQRLTTIEYVKLHRILALDQYRLSLIRYPHYPDISPFVGWDSSNPTKSLPWYHAYNQVKHDREDAFKDAKLEHAISAVAACVILLAAQFGPHSLQRFDLRNLFDFKTVPEWPIVEWCIDPVAGMSWSKHLFQI